MASIVSFAKDFSPFTPDLDVRRFPKTGIIKGRNYLFDVDGPRSAFGTRYADYNHWPRPERYRMVELEVNGIFFYGTPRGIFKINPVSKLPEPILTVDVTNDWWPWTVALVGNIYYFAQYNVGLWQYNAITNTVAKLNTPVFDNVIWVTAAYGRLVALNATLVMWSAQDDGTDFIPSLLTGAGAQALSLIGGTAFRADTMSDGFIVATSKGLLKAEFVQAEFIWSFYVLSKDVKIFSPNAATNIPDIGVIYIDPSGFHATEGTVPTPWENDMSVYLKDRFIKGLNRNKVGTLGMYFSQAARMLFVYFSSNEEEGIMNTTMVYYLPSGKWGQFEERHFGFFETFDPVTSVSTCSFMSVDGYVRALTDLPYREVATVDGRVLRDFVFRPEVETPVLLNEAPSGVIVALGFTDLQFMDTDPTPFEHIEVIQIRQVADDGTVQAHYLPQIGLNAQVDIGLFRFVAQTDADETSYIGNIVVGCKQSLTGFTFENLNTEDGTENLNVEDVNVNYGTTFALNNIFTLELLDTNDGYSEPFQGWETLYSIHVEGASYQYMPSGQSSISHRLRFSALNPGESFALKTIDITGTLTGRLF